jgi:hypothetical protein
VHLVYFKGSAGAGDIYYVREAPAYRSFSSSAPSNDAMDWSAVAIAARKGWNGGWSWE